MKSKYDVYCVRCKSFIYTELQISRINKLIREDKENTRRNICRTCANDLIGHYFQIFCEGGSI